MALKRNGKPSRRGKKNTKEIGLVLLTILMFVLLVVGFIYTQSDSFINRNHKPTTSVKTPSPVAQSSTSEEQTTTESHAVPKTEDGVEWVKQETPVKIPILMYHAIHVMAPGEEGNYNLIVDPTTFESHLKALHDAGYYSLTPEEAYKAFSENVLPKDKKVVWLTFDDSLWDFYQIAYPLLKQYQMKATNNVITGTVGHEGNLTMDEMHELKQNGISLQGHTVNHPALGSTDPAVQNTELAESKTYLDTNLQQDTISLAYPSGSYTEETINLVQQNHYKMALTTNEGLASAENGLLSLNRVRVLPTTTAEILLQTIAVQ